MPFIKNKWSEKKKASVPDKKKTTSQPETHKPFISMPSIKSTLRGVRK